MTHGIISDLVDQYESGRLGRKWLIQSPQTGTPR